MPLHVFFPCFGTKTVPFLERESCVRHGVTLVYTSSVHQARGDERKGKEKTGLSHFLHTDKVRKCPTVVWEEGGWMTDALALQFYQLQLIRHREVLFLPESPLGNGGGGGGKSSTGSSISGRAGPSSPVKKI